MLDLAIRRQLGDFSLDIRLEVADVGITSLFGRSGAGKTSVIAAIAGLLRPDAGHVRVAGRTLFDAAAGIDVAPHRRRVGYVFQDSRLFPHLSVEDNLLYGYRRVPAVERGIAPERIVDLLGIGALLQRRPRGLSGGERQRVAIGRALLAQPKILLLDEPLASLDAPRKREILPYIAQLRDALALPIVYVSHVLDEVLALADDLAIIDAGRVIAAGAPQLLLQRLDLHPLLGGPDASVLLEAVVAAHDTQFQLSTLRVAGGVLRVPHVNAAIGTRLRVRIRERDVALALEPPAGLSIQNALEGRVAEIREEAGPMAEVRVELAAGGIVARITRESVHRLHLAPGRKVFALMKAVAFEDSGG
jgi:molybdate transport system ATP-binding protein